MATEVLDFEVVHELLVYQDANTCTSAASVGPKGLNTFVFEDCSHGISFTIRGMRLANHNEVIFTEQFEHAVPSQFMLLWASSAKTVGIPNGSSVVAFVSHIHEVIELVILVRGSDLFPLVVAGGLAPGKVTGAARGGRSAVRPDFSPLALGIIALRLPGSPNAFAAAHRIVR